MRMTKTTWVTRETSTTRTTVYVCADCHGVISGEPGAVDWGMEFGNEGPVWEDARHPEGHTIYVAPFWGNSVYCRRCGEYPGGWYFEYTIDPEMYEHSPEEYAGCCDYGYAKDEDED